MTEGPVQHSPAAVAAGSDPSTLTTAALQREIQHLRELLEASDSQIREHLDAADSQYYRLASAHIDDLRRSLAEADLRYQQRYDSQTRALDDARVSADLAVQAALVAAEKAVSKAEVAAEKRFDVVSERVDDVKNSSTTQLAALQSQIAAMTARGQGGSENRAGLYAALGALGVIISVIVVIMNTVAR